MGYLAQTAADIAQIIENIDFVANKNTLTFHSEEKIINTLADTRSIIGNVDIMILLNVIWDKTSYPDRVSQAEFLLSEKFKSLLNWKKEINDIVVLRDALKNDCTSFFNNCRSIGNTMTSTGFDNLIIFYEQIYDSCGPGFYEQFSTPLENVTFMAIPYFQVQIYVFR